jgi:hypothetical protein
MKDSYREVYPDPVLKPGNIWSPVFQGREPQDRIDMIYFKGRGLKVVTSAVFTTDVESTQGSWESPTAVTRKNTWPSDHAAVVFTFQFKSEQESR